MKYRQIKTDWWKKPVKSATSAKMCQSALAHVDVVSFFFYPEMRPGTCNNGDYLQASAGIHGRERGPSNSLKLNKRITFLNEVWEKSSRTRSAHWSHDDHTAAGPGPETLIRSACVCGLRLSSVISSVCLCVWAQDTHRENMWKWKSRRQDSNSEVWASVMILQNKMRDDIFGNIKDKPNDSINNCEEKISHYQKFSNPVPRRQSVTSKSPSRVCVACKNSSAAIGSNVNRNYKLWGPLPNGGNRSNFGKATVKPRSV